jgi:hypothetical protein
MSTSNRRFSLALEALTELKMETSSPLSTPVPAAPTLSGVLSEIGPLPREALFLGVASDGLPVLLNLRDPLPGPILITGDPGSGKTRLLQMITHAVALTHKSEDVQYAVITSHTDEWDDVKTTPHGVGVFPSYHTGAQDLLLSLASWAHANKNPRQSVLLFIDGLESAASLDFDAVQNLRWLLLRGPSRGVWPIVTMNAERYGQVLSWIPNFRTRIFGCIKDERIAAALGGDPASALDSLQAGIQFSLRENRDWLRFWLPSL